MEVLIDAVPNLVDKVIVLLALSDKPRTEALAGDLVRFCQYLVDIGNLIGKELIIYA